MAITIHKNKIAVMVMSAKAFKENSKYVFEQVYNNMGKICYKDDFPVFMSNAYFAMELFLKALLASETLLDCSDDNNNVSYPSGHYLLTLFSKLDKDFSKSLCNKFFNETKSDLIKSLERWNKGFEKWRYHFESVCLKGENYSDIMVFLKILEEECQKIINSLDFSDDSDNSEGIHSITI